MPTTSADSSLIASHRVVDADSLLTPCLLLSPDVVRENLATMIDLAGGASRVRPHVKTHKCPGIVHLELAAGIDKHKCATLREAAMLAACGVPDVLIAYPLIGPAVRKLRELCEQFPATRFMTLVDSPAAAQQLDSVFARTGRRIDVMLDIDTGLHRTGVPADQRAVELYAALSDYRHLHVRGMQIYDGQHHMPSRDERCSAVQSLMEAVVQVLTAVRRAGHEVATLVCGGTPTFSFFAAVEIPAFSGELECSPGTCVLHDANYARLFDDLHPFRYACSLLTRVVSKPVAGCVTLDLGYKAVASDAPLTHRAVFPELPDATIVSHHEEHMVVRCRAADELAVGAVLHAVPGHVCPTVALHDAFQIVANGRVTASWPITRDRYYRLESTA
ncbi:MAG: threonine aldolase [Pirellulaceae bacterium]|nr:MAG: threonine aldolase [Pirellulaceae bacterium]